MSWQILSISFFLAALALAVSGCEAVPTLTFAEADASDDASDATEDAPQVGCPTPDGGTILCEGTACADSCSLCLQCTKPGQLCCATPNSVTCKARAAMCP
jgi:hypothetical protein